VQTLSSTPGTTKKKNTTYDKGSFHQEDVSILNKYAPNNKASRHKFMAGEFNKSVGGGRGRRGCWGTDVIEVNYICMKIAQ
jgi:hypothetical protein